MIDKVKVRVLVVDDSSFMRRAIKGMIEEDSHIQVIGMARDGQEAVDMVLELKPDVVTLDVEMPVMDGLEALKQIMEKCPTPVLMLSSLSTEGAKITLQALELGAVDFIPKNLEAFSLNIFKVKEMIVNKIKAVSVERVKRKVAAASVAPKPDMRIGTLKVDKFGAQRVALVAIGASTGGPKAVQEILKVMPGDLPLAFLVVQHMPKNFTGPYAERLDQLSHLDVREAKEGDHFKNGLVLVAPGGIQMKLRKVGALDTVVHLADDPVDAIYKPSVNETFKTVAKCFPGRALGVILTGMGADGAEGIKYMKDTGCKVLVQDEESCVVYGMPKAVVDAHLEDKIVSLQEMPGEILNMV